MNYQKIYLGTFLNRPNRFIAHCLLDGKIVVVHVKNTGRGAEVFLKGAEVALSYSDNPKRKTKYDLVAIKKSGAWFNIDSQVTNALVEESLKNQEIILPILSHLTLIRREVFFGDSKFDFYLEDNLGQKAFLEVKSMTLENEGIGAFPDAPTLRGLKHVNELQAVKDAGYLGYIVFIAQSELMKKATIHQSMQPELALAIKKAQEKGIEVLSYNCLIKPDRIQIKEEIPFSLEFPFKNPVID